MKPLIQMGQQEGKENVWCSPQSPVHIYVLFGILSVQPLLLFKVHVFIHDQCLVCALSLTQMQRLSRR